MDWERFFKGMFVIVVAILCGALVLCSVYFSAGGATATAKARAAADDCVLAVDTRGCKVYRLSVDGRTYLVNNQGGIVEVRP